MANPVLVDCPEGQWTKVATDIQSGAVHIVSTDPDRYTYTYRDTGETAPATFAEAVPFDKSITFGGPEVTGLDVYVWPLGAAGKVRADIYPITASYSVALV
jgi:hypothetical protein